jgi:hypothetical protein
MNKQYEVYEAVADGMLLFKAEFEELCNIFEKKPDYIKRSIRLGAMVDKLYNIVDPENPVKLKQVNHYGVYDMEDGELLVCMGCKDEIKKFFNIGDETFFSASSRGSWIQWRYKIERL